MTTDSYTVSHRRFNPTDPRLGRHVRHDSRSKQYAYPATDINSIRSIRHERYVPILNQGKLGSCTGNAATGCVGTGFFWAQGPVQDTLAPMNADLLEQFAVEVYSDATQLDSAPGTYPPNDTGSDGLSVAKALKNRGLISGYRHALSFEALLVALSSQPVIVGTTWLEGMFTPASDGKIQVAGSIAGGHEYALDELDVENERVWMDQSWGEAWGVDGRGYFTWQDMRTLMSNQGDCTVFSPLSQPAPTPTPIPTPEPAPAPPADPTAVLEAAQTLQTSLSVFVSALQS